MRIKKAIIPAAGFGTRFLPMTKATPKEMLNIVDKPAIQYVVEEAVASGIEEILIITSRNKTTLENHFDMTPELDQLLTEKGRLDLLKVSLDVTNLADIYFKRQKESKGLGHAIYQAKNFVGNEPFAVLLADDIIDSQTPCLKQLIDIYEETPGTILGIQAVEKKDVKKYGIIGGKKLSEGKFEVQDMIEKPSSAEAPSNLAILGRYIISPSLFDILESAEPGKGGEVQLTDALSVLMLKEPMYAYIFEGKRYDVGDKLGYLKATIDFALKNHELKDGLEAYIKKIQT